EAAHAIYGDPEAMRFWDMAPSKDQAQTVARIGYSAAVDPEAQVMWAILNKGNRQFVGMVNYHAWNHSQRRLALGWIIGRSHWQQGYATEAVAAVLAHCFTVLQVHRVEARIEPENTASIRLAER